MDDHKKLSKDKGSSDILENQYPSISEATVILQNVRDGIKVKIYDLIFKKI